MEYELPLLIGGHLGHGADGGIVGCDEWRIYSNAAWLPGVSDHPLCDGCVEKAMDGSMEVEDNGDGNAMNSPIFLKLWRHVFTSGVHRRHTWVVKTEADVVFAGSRLRDYLFPLPLGGTPSEPSSLKPTIILNMFGTELWGGVEAVSSSALDSWAANPNACDNWWDLNDQEDYWLKACMGHLGVGLLALGQLFRDDGDPDWHRDWGDWHPDCGTEHATFTRMKNEAQWSACFVGIAASDDAAFGRMVEGEVNAARNAGWG